MRYAFGLFQDGMMVAEVDAPTEKAARREINHYALMYSQDGPVEVKQLDLATMEPSD